MSAITPKRILILGCGGAGKSTLSRRLGAALDLPVVHLDVLYWKPGWTESSYEEMLAKVETAAAQDAWVMDGNYSRFLEPRLARAEMLIFLDMPRWRCIFNLLWRLAKNYGRHRIDMAPGCNECWDYEFLKWVWDFPRRSRSNVLKQCELAKERIPVHRITSYRQMDALVRELTAQYEPALQQQ